jgi:hypothetical protein
MGLIGFANESGRLKLYSDGLILLGAMVGSPAQ